MRGVLAAEARPLCALSPFALVLSRHSLAFDRSSAVTCLGVWISEFLLLEFIEPLGCAGYCPSWGSFEEIC